MKLAFYFVFVSILTKEACSLFLCVFDSFLYSTLCLFVCNTKLIFYLLIVRKTIYSNMIIFMCCFQAYFEVFFPFSGYSLKLNYSSFIFPSAVYLPIMQRLFVPSTYSFLFPFIVLCYTYLSSCLEIDENKQKEAGFVRLKSKFVQEQPYHSSVCSSELSIVWPRFESRAHHQLCLEFNLLI